MDTKQIIERLEAASGPDRKIDAAISRLFDLPLCVEPDCLPDVFAKIIDRVERGEWDQDPEVKFYTSSIDAALSLVPEEENWSVRYQDEADIERWYEATVGEHYVEVRSSPAIALVIAALRARAHKGEG